MLEISEREPLAESLASTGDDHVSIGVGNGGGEVDGIGRGDSDVLKERYEKV